MSTPNRTSPPYDLEITIISGKHLKNVNWKNGNLKPYAIFWVDPDNKLTTKSDDSGHTKPVWNQRFILPINLSLPDSSFSLEIFHSKASEAPKPFVGSLHINLSDLPDPTNGTMIRTFDLLRPSGRPQGKIRLRVSIKDYQNAPVSPYYYSSAPPYPYASSSSRAGPTTATYPYSMGYYSGYYPPPPPVHPRPFSDRYGAPSAPVEYSRVGAGAGAVAGTLGGMTLDDGLKREEGKMGESSGLRDDISDYRADY